MGKRKSASSKAAPRKKMEKLETTFCCPFCSHAAAVECVIDLEQEIATASCYVCQESYSTVPDTLTEPIDVYSEWIDECERVNEGVPRRRRPVVCKRSAVPAQPMCGGLAAAGGPE
ncbi:transcription elongation factor 1 homolog [Lolium rigidum]|uniref:transcription elongation factor 1 homolog n=1 Tax=Lolium rigidum TaxID=89674 RepID=UPI001F5C0ECD|nr:transcription elongation factor 1 homolog [Lolium rigidum]